MNKAVFYNDEVGRKRAELYVRKNAGSARIDELLKRSPKGQLLLDKLENVTWEKKKEIWWELSRKMARTSSGDAHCFGPERLSRSQPTNTHESRFVHGAYAHTVFEKVEPPMLDNNQRVNNIYYNGKEIG